MCMNTWFRDAGSVLEGCGTFRKQSLTRMSGFLSICSLVLLPAHSVLSGLRYIETS